MGLQVWLPLNGNIDNQGLSNYQATNTNAIINTNGKIGKCYQFGPNQSYLELPKECMRNLSTECTVSFWIKFITRNSNYETYFQAGLGGDAWNDYVFGLLRNNNGNSCCFTISNGSSDSNASYTTPNLTELNTWYHITLVYKTGHCLVYINGELYQDYTTTIIPAFDKITTITIGCSNNKTADQTNCLMNDFRIYDTALSPREIKEISRGLVLHYPLNRGGFGGDNIISGTSPNEIQYTYPSSGYSDKFSSITTIVPTASQYTLSFWAKSTVNGDKVTSYYYSPNTTTTCVSNQGISRTASDGNMIFTLSTDWEYYWVTYTQTETTAVKHVIFPRIAAVNNQYNLSCIGSGTISVKCVKFEEGDAPTPWIPNQADALYSQMGLDNNIEYDVSGYKNNGTKAGTITYTADTPRYSTATNFAASSGFFAHPNITFTSFTISFWGKHVAANKMLMGSLASLTNTNLNWYWFGDNSFKYPSGEFYYAHNAGSADSLLGKWIHFVATYDGSVITVYRNGVNEGTKALTETQTMEYLSVGCGHTGSSYWAGGCVSDFRIYATALSADDVMALYHTSISLANNGTLLTQGEYVES